MIEAWVSVCMTYSNLLTIWREKKRKFFFCFHLKIFSSHIVTIVYKEYRSQKTYFMFKKKKTFLAHTSHDVRSFRLKNFSVFLFLFSSVFFFSVFLILFFHQQNVGFLIMDIWLLNIWPRCFIQNCLTTQHSFQRGRIRVRVREIEFKYILQ